MTKQANKSAARDAGQGDSVILSWDDGSKTEISADELARYRAIYGENDYTSLLARKEAA